jgi:hypothetical protein
MSYMTCTSESPLAIDSKGRGVMPAAAASCNNYASSGY